MEEKNTQKKKYEYHNVKIRVSQKEYTLIQDIAGDKNVSTQIRDMFLDEQNFAFKNMPKINRLLLREVIMIDNNLNQLERAFTEYKDKLREDELLYSNDLLSTIKEMLLKILDRNMVKTKSAKDFKKLISSKEDRIQFNPINENRNQEIKICFNDEQYAKLISRCEEQGNIPTARMMREYFITQADKVKKAIPPANYEIIADLNIAGTALNYIARGVNERRKAEASLVLHSVIKQLEQVNDYMEDINNKDKEKVK